MIDRATEPTSGPTPGPTAEAVLALDAVTVGWPERPVVLHGLDLVIRQGERIALLGANGCGKSTLLQLLGGLVAPAAGTVSYRGQAVARGGTGRTPLGRQMRREIGVVFQQPEAMLFNPTVFDEIAYGPRRLGWADVDQQVQRWLRELDLDDLATAPPHSLSGGEKQRLALAAVLVLSPTLLLLDEPAANLDPRAAGWLGDFLLHTRATVVMSTHNLAMARDCTTRSLVLERGAGLLFDGSTAAALADDALMWRAGLRWRRPATGLGTAA